MAQKKVWEQEYQNPLLVTKHDKPQADALRFFKFARKHLNLAWSDLNVADLGSGTGRNANYLAGQGADVVGIELSETAVSISRKRSQELPKVPKYFNQNMGQTWPIKDESIDVALDIISSNSLNENERSVYLSELWRVLRPGGLVLVKALTKDGDKNTQNLLARYPGQEKDTYILPELGLIERVFTEKDLRVLYNDYEFLYFEKKTSRVPFNGQVYKRRFMVAYLRKKA